MTQVIPQYRAAYIVLSFGLLLSTVYRSFVRHESAWDLIGLVVAGGVVATTSLERRGLRMAILAVAIAAVLGALVTLVVR